MKGLVEQKSASDWGLATAATLDAAAHIYQVVKGPGTSPPSPPPPESGKEKG